MQEWAERGRGRGLSETSAQYSRPIAGRRAITREAMFRTVATISFVGKGNEGACIGGKNIYIRSKCHYFWWGDGFRGLPAGVGGHPNAGMARWPSLATQFSTRLLGAISECSENAYNVLVGQYETMI